MPVASARRPRQAATAGSSLQASGERAGVGTARAERRRVAIYDQRSTGKALDTLPTTELMRQVLDETKELVRIESQLARDEVRADLAQLKSAAIFGGVALVLAWLTLSTLIVALVLALGGALVALACAGVLLFGASATAALAYQKLPKPPLARTRERLKSDVTQLKEHIQ
jgi:uncharacterized membrane protein YqjE